MRITSLFMEVNIIVHASRVSNSIQSFQFLGKSVNSVPLSIQFCICRIVILVNLYV